MTMRDLNSGFSAVNALVPQTISTSALNTGNESLAGYSGAQIIVALGSIDGMGAGSPTGGSIAVKVEHADDNGSGSPSSYANVTDADIVGAAASISAGVVKTFQGLPTGSLAEIFQFSYFGDEDCIKVTLTPTGLGAGGPVVIIVNKGRARHAPAGVTQTP